MNTEKLDTLRTKLEELKNELSRIQRNRKSEAEEIIDLIEELNGHTYGDGLSKYFLDRKIIVKLDRYRAGRYGTGQVQKKVYTVKYREKNGTHNKVFKYRKKGLDTWLGRENEIETYKKNKYNWENTLVDAVAEQLQEEIKDAKNELNQDYNHEA